MKKKAILLYISILIILLCACGSKPQADIKFTTLSYFDTQITLFLQNKDFEGDFTTEAEDAWSDAKTTFAKIESAFSLSIENSDVSRFNKAQAGEKVDITLLTDILLYSSFLSMDGTSSDVSNILSSYFTPAIANLVDLWGFSPRFNENGYVPVEDYDRVNPKTPPEQKYIEAFRSFSFPAELDMSIDDGRIYCTKPLDTVTVDGKEYSLKIDFGGMAKGIAADFVNNYLTEKGFKYGYINVGRSSICVLQNNGNGGEWKVSLANPLDTQKTYADVNLSDTSISTSGNYERFFEYEGKRYCHIIDPKTGYPIDNGIVSVSVICVSATLADILSTAFAVMGIDGIREFCEIYEYNIGIAVVYLNDETNKYTVATNITDGFSLTDADFNIEML